MAHQEVLEDGTYLNFTMDFKEVKYAGGVVKCTVKVDEEFYKKGIFKESKAFKFFLSS